MSPLREAIMRAPYAAEEEFTRLARSNRRLVNLMQELIDAYGDRRTASSAALLLRRARAAISEAKRGGEIADEVEA